MIQKGVFRPKMLPLSSYCITQSSSHFIIKFFINFLSLCSKLLTYLDNKKTTLTWHCFDLFSWSWLRWKLPLWREMFCLWIIAMNPWFINSDDLFKHSYYCLPSQNCHERFSDESFPVSMSTILEYILQQHETF